MTSLKPYLIRSIYQWIIDNQLTPHLLVAADTKNAILPEEFIEDGKIVLNIRPEAVVGLTLGNKIVEFDARFSGRSMHISTPVASILAIYAKENGKGMIFDQEEDNDDDDQSPPDPPQKRPNRPNLRRVK